MKTVKIQIISRRRLMALAIIAAAFSLLFVVTVAEKKVRSAKPTTSSNSVNLWLDGFEGTSSIRSLGRESSILLESYEQTVGDKVKSGSMIGELKVTMKVDVNTPKFMLAAVTGQTIKTGKLAVFDDNDSGNGTTEKFLEIDVANLKVTSAKQLKSNNETLLEVAFSEFEKIEWTEYKDGLPHKTGWDYKHNKEITY